MLHNYFQNVFKPIALHRFESDTLACIQFTQTNALIPNVRNKKCYFIMKLGHLIKAKKKRRDVTER